MSMRIAKRPTLFFRFFGVGFAHTFHKFYNLLSNTLISFNFFVTRRYDHHSRPFNTRAGPSSPMVTQASPYCRLAIRALGYGYCPTGNTPTRRRYVASAQYAPLARLCAHCVARIRRAYFAPWAQYAYAATAIALRAIRLRGYGYCPTGNTPTRRRYFASAQYAPLARLCAHCVARIRRAFRLRRSQSKRRACVPIEARSQTFLAPREHVPANRYIHQYADANHHAQNARTTIRNERQSNPNDGCPTHDHGRIDDDLPKEYGCYPHC